MPEWRRGRHRGQFVAVRGYGNSRERHPLGTDREEADRLIHRLNNPRPVRPTVAWLWAEYVKEKEGRAVLATMEHTWKALGPHFGHHDPEEITHEMCVDYIQRRERVGRSAGTIHTELGHLRTVVSWAARRRYIGHASYIHRPSKPTPRDRHLTRDQARRLLDAASFPHVRLAIVLLLGTAARVRAILDLTWDRCDMNRGLIHLRDPDDPTRRKGRATVPMNGMVRAALSEAQTGALTPYVIEWGGKPVRSLKRGLKSTSLRAGLEPVSPHVLRHTAAVWMAEAGRPMTEIAQYLGHGDSRTTERVYARFSPDYLRESAEVLDFGLVQSYQRNLRKSSLSD